MILAIGPDVPSSVNLIPPAFNVVAVTTPTTLAPPARTFIPFLAVTIPTESTFVTSSYVSTPPTDRFPLTVAFPVTSIPEAKSTLVPISMCPSVLTFTTLISLPPVFHCTTSKVPPSAATL